MRPLRFYINVTLDGCYDHMAGIPTEESHHHATESIANADALLIGRVTYGMMEEAWREPSRTGIKAEWMEDWMMPFARTIGAAKKYVVSRTLERVDWNAEIIGKDLEAAVRQLKAQPGRRIAVGGVQLAQSLTELGLIDEYELLVHPRIAGHGPYLFGGLSKHVDLKLVDQRSLRSGAVALRYERVR